MNYSRTNIVIKTLVAVHSRKAGSIIGEGTFNYYEYRNPYTVSRYGSGKYYNINLENTIQDIYYNDHCIKITGNKLC